MISAKIIADSIEPSGHRLTTMVVVMPRIVLAEFNTHRAFSRNSASSRAIPTHKRIEEVLYSPFVPLEWGSNKKGMQAGEEIAAIEEAKDHWHCAKREAVQYARKLQDLGVHKQIVNRLLEPFLWHTVVVSATEWQNFFSQRCSPLAQPEIRLVAEAMRDALNQHTPQPISKDGWHLPFITPSDLEDKNVLGEQLKKISVARCARVSYLNHEGKRDVENDLNLYDKLINAKPPHLSPFEHVATPAIRLQFTSNFQGWNQLRHLVGAI